MEKLVFSALARRSFMISAFALYASATFAQDPAATARSQAGCGPDKVRFEVQKDKNHPITKPEHGKALVYVFSDTDYDNLALHVGGLVTRVGIDGVWVGANDMRSYFFFPVDPGDHRLCTSQQSKLKSQRNNSAAASFTAESGETYFFRTQTPRGRNPVEAVELVEFDPAEGALLAGKIDHSIAKPKK